MRTGRQDNTIGAVGGVGAAAARARQYAVAVALVVLSLLTVVGPHLHQVTAEAASPGIVCRDARDCAVPTQPQRDRDHDTPTLVARRADQLPRRAAAPAEPVALAADLVAVPRPWTQGSHQADAAPSSQPPDRSPDLRAPPSA